MENLKDWCIENDETYYTRNDYRRRIITLFTESRFMMAIGLMILGYCLYVTIHGLWVWRAMRSMLPTEFEVWMKEYEA